MEITSASIVLPATRAQAPTQPAGLAAGTPWYCKAVVAGAVFIVAGIVWDISWHETIGRDTFWTLAHICIHIGGTLGGLV